MRDFAAWGTAALLVGWLALRAAPGPPPGPSPCAMPLEVAAARGHTRVVDCACTGRALRGPARLLFGLPLDLNAADAGSFEVLPGIGPARARAIVEERGRAPFERVADLVRVRGIGPITLGRIAGDLATGPASGKTGSLPMDAWRPAACTTPREARGEHS